MSKAQDLAGDDWVLFDPHTNECILAPSGKGLIVFDSEEAATAFRDKYDAIAHFEPKQVRDIMPGG